MIQELMKFYSERSDFLLPLILEHLQISIIAIIIATMIGIALGIFIAENKKTSPIIHNPFYLYVRFFNTSNWNWK